MSLLVIIFGNHQQVRHLLFCSNKILRSNEECLRKHEESGERIKGKSYNDGEILFPILIIIIFLKIS